MGSEFTPTEVIAWAGLSNEQPNPARTDEIITTIPQLFEKLVAQVNKDLEVAGTGASINPSNLPHLYELMDDLVNHFADSNTEMLASWLYRIDLPANKIPLDEAGRIDTTYLGTIILRRELLKVLMRMHYAGELGI